MIEQFVSEVFCKSSLRFRHTKIRYEAAQLVDALRCKQEGRGFDSNRVRWLRCLGRRSVAARLLGLGVRIPLRAWMLVFCCTVRTKGKSQDNQDKETSTDEVHRKNNRITKISR